MKKPKFIFQTFFKKKYILAGITKTIQICFFIEFWKPSYFLEGAKIQVFSVFFLNKFFKMFADDTTLGYVNLITLI